MIYLWFSFFLFVVLILFLKVARKYFIIDKPNLRSSHTYEPIRGGGIIFWFAAMFYMVFNYPKPLLFFLGLTIVTIISFIDDLLTVNGWLRLISQLIGITLILVSLNEFLLQRWYIILTEYILFAGILNAYNFMDGINGMTGLYSISILGALQWVNLNVLYFIAADFIWYPMITCAIFLFFNFRKRALCFAGDVGSISIAFWITTLILILIIKTNAIVWVLFLSLYGIDSVLTIIHRLWLKQNIFSAHRMHFYQILANEYGFDHRVISIAYSISQAIISTIVILIYDKLNPLKIFAIILIPLVFLYLFKFYKPYSKVNYN